jgi:hypothetical protein
MPFVEYDPATYFSNRGNADQPPIGLPSDATFGNSGLYAGGLTYPQYMVTTDSIITPDNFVVVGADLNMGSGAVLIACQPPTLSGGFFNVLSVLGQPEGVTVGARPVSPGHFAFNISAEGISLVDIPCTGDFFCYFTWNTSGLTMSGTYATEGNIAVSGSWSHTFAQIMDIHEVNFRVGFAFGDSWISAGALGPTYNPIANNVWVGSLPRPDFFFTVTDETGLGFVNFSGSVELCHHTDLCHMIFQ